MHTYHIGVLPDPMNRLFSLNNEKHNYNTRHANDLQTNLRGMGGMFISFSVFMPHIFGIKYLKKFKLVYDTHVLNIYPENTYKLIIYTMI